METVIETPQRAVRLYDENASVWKFVRNDKGPLRSVELIENMFHNLGLSKNEIKVYVHLARSAEQKASEISKALSLHRTETYRILRDLEKRGLVASVFEKPLRFIATPFEKAIEALIEAKKLRIQQLERTSKDLINVWLSLPQPRVEHERKEVFQILEGEEQIDSKANDLARNAEDEIRIFASEEDLARMYHSGFVDGLEKRSKEKSFDIRVLTGSSRKSRFFVEKMSLPSVRLSLSDVEDVPTFILTDQRQLLLTIRKNRHRSNDKSKRTKIAALWTNYEAFTNALDKLFSALWNTEKP